MDFRNGRVRLSFPLIGLFGTLYFVANGHCLGGAICSEGLPPSVVYAHEHSGVHYVYNNTERTLLAMDNIDAFDYWYKGRVSPPKANLTY